MQILIIGPSWVGDMMMSHSLYQSLKQQNPDCQIDVLAPAWCSALLERMPEIRKAITMQLGHGAFALRKRYELGKSLRNQYDMAIVLPNSWKSALIPWFAKIPVRRGWKGESRYFLLTDLRHNKRDYPRMVQRYVALAYPANAIPKAQQLKIPTPYLLSNPEFNQSLKPFVQADINADSQHQVELANSLQYEFQHNRPIIGFCPGAEFGPAKRWPHYHYAELANILIQQGFCIRFFGSNKDQAICNDIIHNLTTEQQRFTANLAGKTSLTEAIDLIAGCQAIVTNDSGLMHIAAATQRPIVALYGPTSPEYTPPLSENACIIRLIEGGLLKVRKGKDSAEGYHQSLIDIQPSLVAEKLNELLKFERKKENNMQ